MLQAIRAHLSPIGRGFAYVAGVLVIGGMLSVASHTYVNGIPSFEFVIFRWGMLLAPLLYVLPAVPVLPASLLTILQWLVVGAWVGFTIGTASSTRAVVWAAISVVASMVIVGRLLIFLGFSPWLCHLV